MSTFYEIEMDNTQWPFWFLSDLKDGNGQKVDPRLYARSRELPPYENLSMQITEEGPPIDFSFSALDIIIISKKAGDIIQQLCGDDITRIPVAIDGVGEGYEILFIHCFIDCIDRDNTEHIMYWTEDDHRADLAGGFRMIIGMKVNPEKIGKTHLARVQGWPQAVICSQSLKDALERENITGIRFEKVS